MELGVTWQIISQPGREIQEKEILPSKWTTWGGKDQAFRPELDPVGGDAGFPRKDVTSPQLMPTLKELTAESSLPSSSKADLGGASPCYSTGIKKT